MGVVPRWPASARVAALIVPRAFLPCKPRSTRHVGQGDIRLSPETRLVPEAPAFTRGRFTITEAPAFTRGRLTFTLRPPRARAPRGSPRVHAGEVHVHPTCPAPRAPRGSPRVHAPRASPSAYAPRAPARRAEAPAFTRGSLTFSLRPPRARAPRGSPRVHAGEAHVRPTPPARPRAARKPPRSRGGGSRSPKPPRLRGGGSPSPYAPARRAHLGSPRVYAGERHLHPTPPAPRAHPGSPRVHAAGASRSPYAAQSRAATSTGTGSIPSSENICNLANMLSPHVGPRPAHIAARIVPPTPPPRKPHLAISDHDDIYLSPFPQHVANGSTAIQEPKPGDGSTTSLTLTAGRGGGVRAGP
jgi:hypothetical protein